MEIANVTNAKRHNLAQIIAMQDEQCKPKNEYCSNQIRRGFRTSWCGKQFSKHERIESYEKQ